MTWEEHIAERLDAGFFEAEEYVVIFYLEGKAVWIADVTMVACCPASITFTTSKVEKREADALKLLVGALPAKEQQLKRGPVEGRMRIKFKRPM